MTESSVHPRILVGAIAVVLAASACAGGGSPSPSAIATASPSGSQSAPTSPPAEPVTLNIVWFDDAHESDQLQVIQADYQKTHPNVQFTLTIVPYGELATKVKTMIAGGQPPALVLATTPGDFEGSLVDLSQYMDRTQFLSQFIPAVQPYALVNGKPAAAPINVTAHGILYNKALFEKAGVSVPTSPDDVWTWAEFEEAIQQVMATGGARIGLAFDKTFFRFSTLIYQAGGRILSDDGKQMLINSPEAVSAFTYFLKLHDDGVADKSVWLGGERASDLFLTGQTAALWSGDWQLPSLATNASFPWGVTYMPKGKIRSTVAGGKQMLVIKGSGVEKEAFDFLEYFISPEVNAKYCIANNMLSAIQGNGDLAYATMADLEKIFANELGVSPPAAANDWYYLDNVIPELYTPMGDNVVSMLQGKMTPQEAADDIAAQGQALIAKEPSPAP